MDPGFRTPLLDMFRRGEVARDVRLLAAQGALAPRAQEQLGLLVLLTDDDDPEIAGAAEATLAVIPPGSIAAFLGRSDTPSELRAFFSGRGIEPSAEAATPAEEPLVDTSADPEASEDGESTEDDDEGSTVQKISSMNVAQRLSLAMKGSREERTILIRDPNKIVAVAVLSSPKLTETEIESIARMTNVSEEILRIISNTRAWMKNYSVALALTKNPKTPVPVAMNLLARLNERDLRMLSADRNVADVVRITARKKVVIEK
ncbi:MAG TPA: hypothetical protein VL173_14900 [Vicinamibacterales bacterium]|jgi:hypothetical protein|nr:hypothetical protein [Vicinamibacterales bacterium]